MSTIRDIKDYYESKQKDYQEARLELERATDEFNSKYGSISKGIKPLTDSFTKGLYEHLYSRLNINPRHSSYSSTLSELFFEDGEIEKISFNNRYYLSAEEPTFTYMIRDKNFNAMEGEIPLDFSVMEAGEWLLLKYYDFLLKN